MLAPHLLLKPSASVNTCEPSRVARLSDLLLHYFHYLILLLRKTFIITELGIKELAQRGGSGVLLGSICGSREVFFSRRSHLQGKVKIEPVRGVEGMKGGWTSTPSSLSLSPSLARPQKSTSELVCVCRKRQSSEASRETLIEVADLKSTCSTHVQMASKGRTLTVNRKKYLSPPREKRANVSVKNSQDGNVGQTEAFSRTSARLQDRLSGNSAQWYSSSYW